MFESMYYSETNIVQNNVPRYVLHRYPKAYHCAMVIDMFAMTGVMHCRHVCDVGWMHVDYVVVHCMCGNPAEAGTLHQM